MKDPVTSRLSRPNATGSNYLNYGGDSIFRDPSENIKFCCGTATDLTVEHYQRPEIKADIIAYCLNEGAIRALNGDDGWYKLAAEPGKVQLTTPYDYDTLIQKHRTVYATLDLLDPEIKNVSEKWNERKGAPETPIGTLANCLAFTLSVDIDSIKGSNGEDITTSPEIKAAVEAAGQFFVDYLREHSIAKSVHCLYSGGGIYVHIHHALFRAGADWTPENREHGFRSATMAYNALIAEIERRFFEAHPEHQGKVKFDKLNNQKRKFKALFSIHRKLPVAVIPLNPDHIKIDFNKARLPLSAEVLAEGRQWYQTYDLNEKEALKALLAPFAERAEGELKERKERTGDYEISRALEPIACEDFPPCVRNILQKAEPSQGPHRALAVLAAYLYQAGWPEDEAFKLWSPVSERTGVETRIFDQWYGVMSCPNCKTIQRESAGYPSVGLGGLGYCEPDEKCDRWPGDYGVIHYLSKLGDSGNGLFDQPLTRAVCNQIEAATGVHIYNALDDPKSNEISEEELNAYSLPEGPKFECNLPTDHFIQRFIAYGSDISDAYLEYWFAGGLFALAVVADKKLKVTLKQGTIYPNLYISINGKSSLARKSTAVDKTEAMLCQVLPSLLSSLVPTEFSPEAFTEHMSDHNHAPWIRDEAAGVLSLMKRDYMRGFKDSLMQLYDCKPFYRKLRTSQRKSAKTEFRVDDPYLNVLFATTDASLGANTEQNDTLSGFMARFLFFFPQGKKTKWLPLEEGTAVNSTFEDVVRSQLSNIVSKVDGLQECTAMHFSQEAASYYTEWQRVREEAWTASNDGNAMQIYSRLAPTVTKLGMLFELGSPDFNVSRPIRLEFIMEACQLVDLYLMPTARAVYDLVGANAEKNVIDRIIAYLKKHNGKATKKEIMRDVKIKSADFHEYLATMAESGTVETKTVKRGGKGRDGLWVLLLDQPTIGKIAIIDKIAKIAKVEDIPSKNSSENEEGKNSTLAILATKDILPILVTDAQGNEENMTSSKDVFSSDHKERGLGPHPRKDKPTPETKSSSEKIRVAAISEFGTAGWVDPAKLAHKLGIPITEAEAWLQANYVAYERPGGGTGYRQRRAGEAEVLQHRSQFLLETLCRAADEIKRIDERLTFILEGRRPGARVA